MHGILLLMSLLFPQLRGCVWNHSGDFCFVVQCMKTGFSLQLCFSKTSVYSTVMLVNLTHLMLRRNLKIN